MAKIFWKMSLLVMRHGFMVMTLKPNNNPNTGRVLLHLTPRKRDRCAHEWQQCCLFFRSRHYALWIFSWRPDKIFIWRFWDICGMQCEESDLKCGLQEAGSSITILHLLPHHCLLDISWKNIQFLPFHCPPIHLTYPSDFLYSLNSKLPLKEDFRQWKTSSLVQRWLKGNTTTILWAVLPKVE
jgi:hypothetical protein